MFNPRFKHNISNSRLKDLSNSRLKDLSNSRLKVICHSYPDRDQEFASLGFYLEDDSLLTIEGKVEGETIPLTTVKTEDLQNTPGIYAIRCLLNKNYLVGETNNRKNRIPTRLKN